MLNPMKNLDTMIQNKSKTPDDYEFHKTNIMLHIDGHKKFDELSRMEKWILVEWEMLEQQISKLWNEDF